MTTPAKLYGKDLSEYEDVDVEALLGQLSADEINILAKEVDPDVSKILTILIFQYRYFFLHHRINFCLRIKGTATNVLSHQLDLWIGKS